MIKISVEKRNNAYMRFVSRGHAEYAEEGQDIICAAVSALIISAVNGLEAFTSEKFELRQEDGYVSVQFTEPTGEKGTLLMDTLVLGLTNIKNSYNPRYKQRFLAIKVKEV
ncbi:MAG: ribosomal-processing cysteine protease Prp [Eubacteriales bacterium]|nr:ribosomal-processing cysteine protease Prp [Eubacteriales bacterium]